MNADTYTVAGKGLTIIANATLVFINPGTTASIEVLRAWVSQYGTATGQQLGVQLSTQVTAFPTLVSATPAAHKVSSVASASKITGGTAGAAGTSGVNASAEGAGAKTVVVPDAFNNLNGWLYIPTPEERFVMAAGASSGIGLVMVGTPTTLTSWSFGISFREW